MDDLRIGMTAPTTKIWSAPAAPRPVAPARSMRQRQIARWLRRARREIGLSGSMLIVFLVAVAIFACHVWRG
jgi:hypothetical protein